MTAIRIWIQLDTVCIDSALAFTWTNNEVALNTLPKRQLNSCSFIMPQLTKRAEKEATTSWQSSRILTQFKHERVLIISFIMWTNHWFTAMLLNCAENNLNPPNLSNRKKCYSETIQSLYGLRYINKIELNWIIAIINYINSHSSVHFALAYHIVHRLSK